MNATEYAKSLIQNDSTATPAQKVLVKRAKALMTRQAVLAKNKAALEAQLAKVQESISETVGALNEMGSLLFELKEEEPAATEGAKVLPMPPPADPNTSETIGRPADAPTA